MALQTSGAISLNDIHVEAGGASVSGTGCSINDSDIRGLISKGSGVTMSFSEWYGASAFTTVSGTYYAYTAAQASDYSFRAYQSAGTDNQSYDFSSTTFAGLLCYPSSGGRIQIYGYGRYEASGNPNFSRFGRIYYRNTSGTVIQVPSSGSLSQPSSGAYYHTQLLWQSGTNAGTGWTIRITGGNTTWSTTTYMNGASPAASNTSFNGTKGAAIRSSTTKTGNGYFSQSDTQNAVMTVYLTKANHTSHTVSFDIRSESVASATDDDD